MGTRWRQARHLRCLLTYGAAAHTGDVVVAEYPAPSGRYPSVFDLPCWQRVLRRRDTLVTPMDLCEHGCGPVDAPEQRHHKRTWTVTNDPALSALRGAQMLPGPRPANTLGSSRRLSLTRARPARAPSVRASQTAHGRPRAGECKGGGGDRRCRNHQK